MPRPPEYILSEVSRPYSMQKYATDGDVLFSLRAMYVLNSSITDLRSARNLLSCSSFWYLLRLTLSSIAIGFCPEASHAWGSTDSKRFLADSFQHHHRFLERISRSLRLSGRWRDTKTLFQVG